ncbi:thiamine pyrophosphate-dependent dehydrogenase E1 component subunit alpha [Viridibacillus sp. NPDC093762]|uniref:thiamine pyrophosphate-dependent dehydrogenase E1 component subunit alpha n=1 Tax=Viridibacillus sp. NPDC093762 TaxID=3390720 RepID=UPI003D08B953
MSLNNEEKIELYRRMYLSRKFEDALDKLFAENKLAGWIHSCKGHESTGSAISLILKENDYLVPYHRSRSSILGRGLAAKFLLAEIMGKKTGCCNGFGGEAHIMDPVTNVYGTGGIIGSNIPIGVGLAYSSKLSDDNKVVICGFGEGGSNRGTFHEAINMASIWDLPIVFICENNYYAEFSPQHEQMKLENVADRAVAYGIEGIVIDGYDPLECYEVIEKAVEKARSGKGPTLIEAKTYRLKGHYEGDPMEYRTKEEVEKWAKRDPIVTFKKELLDTSIIDLQTIERLEKAIDDEIEEAVEFALNSEYPSQSDVLSNVYA